LISHLTSEGYKVGSIKHVHHKGFSMDKEGSNTWRFTKAGSKVTVAVSPEEIVVMKKTDSFPNDLDQIIELLERENLDIVFIEGFHSLIAKRKDIPKIITATDVGNLKRTLEGTVQPILAITGMIAQRKPEIGDIKIPIINLPEEGTQLLELVKKYFKSTPNQAEQSGKKSKAAFSAD
jgi:molybdopterin-guanine dinucleotide biosynthesis protein MobB